MSTTRHPFDVISHLASLRRYARALARDPQDAEDLVHDALVKALERRDSFRPGGNIRTWLMSILHNMHVDRLRQLRRQARHIADDPDADSPTAAGQDHAVRLSQLRKAFFRLPEEQRAALHLVAIEGMTYPEAAVALGIPVGTLMSRLSRGRAALRAFEDESGRDPAGRPRHLRLVGGTDDDTR